MHSLTESTAAVEGVAPLPFSPGAQGALPGSFRGGQNSVPCGCPAEALSLETAPLQSCSQPGPLLSCLRPAGEHLSDVSPGEGSSHGVRTTQDGITFDELSQLISN